MVAHEPEMEDDEQCQGACESDMDRPEALAPDPFHNLDIEKAVDREDEYQPERALSEQHPRR